MDSNMLDKLNAMNAEALNPGEFTIEFPKEATQMNWIDEADKEEEPSGSLAAIKGIRRDIMAAMAMHGILAGRRPELEAQILNHTEGIAKSACNIADALIAELDKETK